MSRGWHTKWGPHDRNVVIDLISQNMKLQFRWHRRVCMAAPVKMWNNTNAEISWETDVLSTLMAWVALLPCMSSQAAAALHPEVQNLRKPPVDSNINTMPAFYYSWNADICRTRDRHEANADVCLLEKLTLPLSHWRANSLPVFSCPLWPVTNKVRRLLPWIQRVESYTC